MNAHSPGPWSFEVEENGDEFRLSDVNNEVVVGGCGCCGSPWCSFADARLIASAPDLLEALKMGMNDTLDYIRINNLTGAENNQWIVLAKAAIAKATGESQ